MARRLSLFAGSGALVPHVLEAALASGYKVQVLALTPRDDLAGAKVSEIDLSNPLSIVWKLNVFRTSHIAMAGGIMLSDKNREGLARFARGDAASGEQPQGMGDAALSGLASVLKKMTGADLVGVQEIAPDLLAKEGQVAGPAIDPVQMVHARYALTMAREIGRLDIGQAVVTSGQHTIAVEDIGGTDALVARAGEFIRLGRTGDGSTPVMLAKAVKPQQTHFVDLPAIGPDTVTNAARAGIRTIVIEAGGVLLIERARLIAAANAEGVSILALRHE